MVEYLRLGHHSSTAEFEMVRMNGTNRSTSELCLLESYVVDKGPHPFLLLFACSNITAEPEAIVTTVLIQPL